MIDTQWLLDDMMNDIRPDFSDITKYDLNGDGQLTADDCPFETGSAKAQVWFSKILQPYVQSQATHELMQKFQDTDHPVVGVYKGKALVAGEQGENLGKLDYTIDRLILTKGMSHQGAVRVAQMIKNPIFMVDIPA